MASLVSEDDLREYFPFEIHKDVGDHQVVFSIVSASKRLRGWVGDAAYDAALAEGDTDERKIILRNAEGYLAMHFMMLALNTRLRAGGIVRSEMSEGDTVNSYFSPAETAAFTTQYLEMAREIAEPYLLHDGTPGPAFEVASDGD
ncbi:MAG TPA: hypothetical protein VMM38_01325 [Aridibacter sp.]|nr:hypothetical protein [Aridibacter sp.]